MAMTARLELGASVVGFVPGGDIAKAAVKGATKAGAKAADNVGKVVKGSTAAAADGLSGAQKGAGKVNAPRGPPSPTTSAPKKRGGENEKAALGRQKHEEFKKKVERKKGWDPRPTLEHPITKQKLHPDALTRNGNPIELKPNTPSGRAAGKRQMRKYEAASDGKKGRVIYYEP